MKLIRGAIDVAIPAGSEKAATTRQVRLEPGQALTFTGSVFAKPASGDLEYDLDWPHRLVDYDGAPLSQVVADANRSSSVQIRLGTTGLNHLRVSGTFRTEDPEKLAEKLGATFDLVVDRSSPSEIVLRER